MIREFLDENVYEALQKRLDFIFREFDNIYVSFSGWKDSGLLLNLTLDFRDQYYPEKTIGMFHQVFEAQYTVTTEYIERITISKIQYVHPFLARNGRGLDEVTIKELEEHGYHIRRNGVSNYTLNKKTRIVFIGPIPSHTDDIKSKKDIPSWKRMCYCFLKNDHTCRFMGFGLPRR